MNKNIRTIEMSVRRKTRVRLGIYICLILSYPLVWYIGWIPFADVQDVCLVLPSINPTTNATLALIGDSEKDLGSPGCANRSEKSSIAFRIEEYRVSGISVLVKVAPDAELWSHVFCVFTGHEHRNITPSQHFQSNQQQHSEMKLKSRRRGQPANTNALKFQEKLQKGQELERIKEQKYEQISYSETRIPSNFDRIHVQCLNLHTREDDYNAHFLLMKMDTKSSAVKFGSHPPLSENLDKLSIILLGFDSVSHANFQRFMPTTREYLMGTLDAIEFEGRNAFGMKTIDNLMPILTGCKRASLNSQRSPESFIENCPFIWNRFSDKGYLSFQSEDDLNQFSKLYPAMKEVGNETSGVNADWLAYLTQLNHDRRDVGYAHGCLDYQWLPNLVLDRALQVASYFGSNNMAEPYFHFLWSSTATQDVLGNVQYLDEPAQLLLSDLFESNILNSTILIFMSDRGVFRGAYPTTFEGSIEAKMPFLFFRFPQWFQQKYSTAIKNMKENAKKLTTHFDLHETLLDLLDVGKSISNEILAERDVKPSKNRGISLFQSIPADRSCREAKIPADMCICSA